MKTKHLLCTLALAGAFTACTQDEFVTEVGSENALAGRKSLGKVTFVAPEGADTRWSVENFNTISPELGDGFSLLLVDVPRSGLNGQHIYAYDNYQLVDKIHTNFEFKKEGSNWTSEANLVEGNYLFVAPVQKTLERQAVEITLPTEQNLKMVDGKLDPLSAIREFAESGYPFYIGHRFMSEKGPKGEKREALPEMRSIFAYPEITVANTDDNRDKPAILTKVILKREGNKRFTINAPLNNEAAAKALTNEVFAPQGNDTKDQVVVGDWAGHMSQYFGVWKSIKQEWKNASENAEKIADTEDFEVTLLGKGEQDTYLYNNGLYGATHELLGTPTSTSDYIVINMPEGGIEIPFMGSISFNAIIPAETYSMKTVSEKTQDLVIYAVLANGDVYKKYVTSNTNVTMYPGKRYAAQDYSGLELASKGSKKFFYIDVHEGSHDGIEVVKENEGVVDIVGGVVTVKTKQQMIDAIQAYAATQDLNIIVEGKDVVYDADVNKAVNVDASQDINIQGHIKVIGDTDGETMTMSKRVNIEDAVIEEGAVEVPAGASFGKVFVAPKAALTLATDGKAGTIYNAGTLTLNTALTNVTGDVWNFATLNIGANYTDTKILNSYDACTDNSEVISPSIDDNMLPNVTVLAGGSYTINNSYINYPITVNATEPGKDNAGELILGNNAGIMSYYFNGGRHEGSITNNGEISGEYALTVVQDHEMTVGEEGVVSVAVTIEGPSNALAADAENVPEKMAATVYNSGKMTGEVTVNGLLVMGSSDATVKVTSSSEGEIDNTAKGMISGTASGLTIFAKVSSLDFTTASAKTNSVNLLKGYLTNSIQVSTFRLTGALKAGVKDGNLNLTNDDVNEADVTLEFVEGSSLQMNDGEFRTGENITIKVSAEDVKWTGRGEGNSIIRVFGGAVKGLFWKWNANGYYKAAHGYADIKGCDAYQGANKTVLSWTNEN